MFGCVGVAVLCSVLGFVGWKGGGPERRMAGAIFFSWCIFIGLAWAGARPNGAGLAASDLVLTVGMAVCARAEIEQGVRRSIGLIQLLAAFAMVVSGVGASLHALGAEPVVFKFPVLSHLTMGGALAVLLLATVRRMRLKAAQARTSDRDLGQLCPETLAIN